MDEQSTEKKWFLHCFRNYIAILLHSFSAVDNAKTPTNCGAFELIILEGNQRDILISCCRSSINCMMIL